MAVIVYSALLYNVVVFLFSNTIVFFHVQTSEVLGTSSYMHCNYLRRDQSFSNHDKNKELNHNTNNRAMLAAKKIDGNQEKYINFALKNRN